MIWLIDAIWTHPLVPLHFFCSPTSTSQFIMSYQLEYQECYHKLTHKSVTNTMVLSPNGDWLVKGSDDCTVIVWCTQFSYMLCRIRTHCPVISLVWLINSNGFLLGCKNGMLAFMGFIKVRHQVCWVCVLLTCATAPCYNNILQGS